MNPHKREPYAVWCCLSAGGGRGALAVIWPSAVYSYLHFSKRKYNFKFCL